MGEVPGVLVCDLPAHVDEANVVLLLVWEVGLLGLEVFWRERVVKLARKENFTSFVSLLVHVAFGSAVVGVVVLLVAERGHEHLIFDSKHEGLGRLETLVLLSLKHL